MGFTVEPAALGNHAGQLDGAASRLDEAAAAANATLPEDAYGSICSFIAATTDDTAARLRGGVGELAASMTGHADGVRACLAAYQDIDGRVAASLRSGS